VDGKQAAYLIHWVADCEAKCSSKTLCKAWQLAILTRLVHVPCMANLMVDNLHAMHTKTGR
jgi:hypothetical protein